MVDTPPAMAAAATAAIASSVFIHPIRSSPSISPSTFFFLHPPHRTQTILVNSPPPRKQMTAVLLPPRCASAAVAIASSIDSDEEEVVGEKKLSGAWREIQGSKGWEGLVEPLDPLLRAEIIRYGEFAQACYDAFDFDPHSKYCGTCKHEGPTFFQMLDMGHRGYQISRYLYATSSINLPNFFHKPKPSSSDVWSRHANWMGYVAVATDTDEIARLGRRDIVVAWRGTVTYLEWIQDLKDILHPASFGEADPAIKIESGFYDLYTDKEHACSYCSYSAREQLLAEMKRLAERYKGEELSITITGHSLGAALALVSAYDLAEMRLNAGDDEDGRVSITIQEI
ncbi:Phospholipase A1-Igamma3, chloroplastic [Asimina triloba]